MNNSHFDPHGFGLGAAVGVGALAFTLVNGVQAFANEISEIAAERSEAQRWDELIANMDAVVEINRGLQRVIQQQAAMIDEQAACLSAMSARLFAAEQD